MENRNTEISSIGEFGLIDRLTKDFPLRNDSSKKGVGDDAAVLSYGDKEVLEIGRASCRERVCHYV